ncbi:MAG: hypothetical protein MUO40_12125, partial [Anaerolineaceae bacterium]|nr:hypothetical protein [Anaerolineaceae bacterium]
MSTQIGLLTEIWKVSNGVGGMLHLDAPFTISPGQYLQAWRDGDTASLPVIVYPASVFHDGLLALDKIPSQWLPGDHIRITGPLGHGFLLPSDSHFVALLSPDGDFQRLMPLAQLALGQNASVSLILGSMTDREDLLSTLPEVMEVHDISNIQNALLWADFLAIDLKVEDLSNLDSLLGVSQQDSMQVRQGQVLIRGMVPCAGKAQCGVCAIKTRSGWQFACEDGPV